MVKLACKDYGFECDFEVEGDASKVIEEFGKHTLEEHGIDYGKEVSGIGELDLLVLTLLCNGFVQFIFGTLDYLMGATDSSRADYLRHNPYLLRRLYQFYVCLPCHRVFARPLR